MYSYEKKSSLPFIAQPDQTGIAVISILFASNGKWICLCAGWWGVSKEALVIETEGEKSKLRNQTLWRQGNNSTSYVPIWCFCIIKHPTILLFLWWSFFPYDDYSWFPHDFPIYLCFFSSFIRTTEWHFDILQIGIDRLDGIVDLFDWENIAYWLRTYRRLIKRECRLFTHFRKKRKKNLSQPTYEPFSNMNRTHSQHMEI